MQRLFIIVLVFNLLSCNANIGSSENSRYKRAVSKIKPDRYNVAFLIMDGTYNTEFTAPYDIFQHTIFREGIKSMNVFTVAKTNDKITSFEGVEILPDFNYLKDSLPKIDILVIPSAEHHVDTDLEDQEMISFVKKVD